MRGKAFLSFTSCTEGGITPAYAGKSTKVVPEMDAWRDHPRLCGEKDAAGLRCVSCRGSPPPMRGKVDETGEPYGKDRITPAYAGKSSVCSTPKSLYWDHPRLCGEKIPETAVNAGDTGSPPPMRGKGAGRCRTDLGRRITPAYAGKSKRLEVETTSM